MFRFLTLNAQLFLDSYIQVKIIHKTLSIITYNDLVKVWILCFFCLDPHLYSRILDGNRLYLCPVSSNLVVIEGFLSKTCESGLQDLVQGIL